MDSHGGLKVTIRQTYVDGGHENFRRILIRAGLPGNTANHARCTLRVRNTSSAVPMIISPLFKRYPQKHSVTPSDVQLGKLSGRLRAYVKISPNSNPNKRDLSYGVFPSCPTSCRLTSTDANSIIHEMMLWDPSTFVEILVSKASFNTLT